jgi:hypothetical protein
MINPIQYNKYLNKKSGINGDEYLTQIKQEALDAFCHALNLHEDDIVSWSSRESVTKEFDKAVREAFRL